ncbi:M16 family metallopeptidase [Undibacterium arcticum]
MPKQAAGKDSGVTSLNADQAWRKQVPKAGPQKAFTLPQGDVFTLSNGLTVIHHRNPGLPLVSAELVIKTGSEANPLDKSGLASFTAGMLTEGTSSRTAPQIADQIAQLGASLGAASSADASSAQVASLKHNFSQALDLLADIVLRPSFPTAEVERERSSRLGALSQQRDSAPAVANRVAQAALYGEQHPYGYVELGTEEAIKSMQRDDLQAFWKQHYVPNNAALVVSGDITRAELKALAESRFGGWHSAAVGRSAIGQPQSSTARLILVDKPGAPQTALRVTGIGPDRKTPDYAALQVMNAALGGLFTSRLSNNLREEKGYTYGVQSGFQYHRMPGPFAIASSVRTDVTGPALGEIFKEVRGMIARPMSVKELANARNSQILSLPGKFDTNHSIGASLANIFVYDLGQDYYSRLPKRFASVTGAQAQAVAKKYLQPEQLIVIGVGDKSKIAPQLEPLKLSPVEYRDADGKLLK